MEAHLHEENGQIVLAVRDNGKGISESAIAHSSTFGILGMRERAHSLGGEVQIAGVPDQGTVVTARIPVQSGPPAAPGNAERPALGPNTNLPVPVSSD